MTGVIYARYSSDNPRKESIKGQLRECEAFSEKNDIQIVGTYIDCVLSVKRKLDRFARNRYGSAHYKSILPFYRMPE